MLLFAFIATAAPGYSQPQASVNNQAAILPVAFLPYVASSGGAYDWLQFNFDPQHSGYNNLERTINAANVKNLTVLFQVTLPSVADGAPVYLSSANTANGVRSLIFVTTKAGHTIALDGVTGATVWSNQIPTGSCTINNTGAFPCYSTASPVIDPNRQYVYSYALDGYVHKYQAGTGVEVTTGGWPELASTKPYDEKGSSNLSIATASNGTSYLYVAHAGYPGDLGDYQGHVTAINLNDGTQNVFNAACSNQAVHFTPPTSSPDCPEVQSAIWARSGVVYDARSNRILMTTGNGKYDPANHHWGDTVFAINPDGTGSGGNPLDSYTPTNYQQLQDLDADLGSTAPALLPVPPGSKVQHLAVQSGKDSALRLINLDNMSGQGGPGHTGGELVNSTMLPQGGEVHSAPAVWVNPKDNSTWLFVADILGISGLKLTLDASGNPQLVPVWQSAAGGTSPIIANGVLYYSTGFILALDPTTGTQLWSSPYNGFRHWESPIVANGVLYNTDEISYLTAYSLP